MSYLATNIICLLQKATPISLTGTLTTTLLDSVVIPGNSMGLSGWLQIEVMWSNNSSANNKTLVVQATASNITAAVTTTNIGSNKRILWANQGVTNSQRSYLSTSNVGFGTSNSAPTTSINTALDFTISFKGTLTNVGDIITLEAYSVQLIRSIFP